MWTFLSDIANDKCLIWVRGLTHVSYPYAVNIKWTGYITVNRRAHVSCILRGISFKIRSCKFIPFGQPVNISLPINGGPLRELIQNPRNSKPDLTDNRSEPQGKGTVHGVCYSVVKEESQNDQSHNDHSSVWRELVLWDWNHSWERLCRISQPAQAISTSHLYMNTTKTKSIPFHTSNRW